jgi:hypothetical protein
LQCLLPLRVKVVAAVSVAVGAAVVAVAWEVVRRLVSELIAD